jgi:GAF domain-containing protein
MLKNEVLIGAIVIYRQEVRSFSEKQIELVQNFAAQAVIAIENTRLLNELRESLQQQTATADVLKVISRSTFDLQTVLQTLVESAARLCDADKTTITRQRDGVFYRAETYGFSADFKEYVQGIPIKPERGSLNGRVLLEGRTVHIPDVLDDPEYTFVEGQKVGGYRTTLGVPMLREGMPIGVLSLTRSEVRPFTDKQIELVTTFADQAAIAIENTRLFEAEQQRTRELSASLEQQTATSEVLKVISSSPGELEPVFQAMLENAVRICQASFGVLFRFEDGAWRAAAMYCVPPAFAEYWSRGPQRPGPRTALGRVAETRQTVHIADVTTEPAYIDGEPIFVAAVNLGRFRTILNVPIVRDDDLVGAFAIYRQEVSPFADKQIELVQNFAAQAVIAIENTRLLHELRQSLQQQTATADVLKVISRSTFDLQTVLNTLTESAARLCDADVAAIHRQQGPKYQAIATYGSNAEHRKKILSRLPFEAGRGSVLGRTVLERKPVQVSDVLADPDYSLHDVQQTVGFRTVLGIPLMREGNPIGAIVLMRLTVRPFTEQQIELATTFADQAVIAIENVRLFETEQQRTRELAKSLDDLRTTQDRLVQTQKLASLGQLTAGIAHEIKNPLNFVNNFSGVSVELIDELKDSLRDAPLTEKAREEITELSDTLRNNLDKIVQHGKRADSIVKNMLLHSREGSVEHRPVDINTLVEESLNLAYHGARAEKQGFTIKFERAFDPSAGQADVFPQDITRVLLNLISNGFYAATKRKATAADNAYEPTVTAATKNLGERVEIRIRDNGTGIPHDVREKIFNPFFTTKPTGEGTGLGLSISHDIVVKQHAGSIEVDTEPGEFTEIRVILPRAAAATGSGN